MTSQQRFRDRLVCVTGAAGGIGRATALVFAAEGARVVTADRNAEGALETARACEEAGGSGSDYRVDVADPAAVQELADRVRAEHGVPDVLVNNAGVGMGGAFTDTSLEDWEWIVGINLMGVIHGCRSFGPPMLERGWGHVVNISSVLGYLHLPRTSAYSVTKAGVLALSRGLRAEWRPHGVGVSAVCPGMIATQILEETRFVDPDGEDQREWARGIFAERGRPPEDVAEGVLRAVRDDRAVVPVGADARAAYAMTRTAPSGVTSLLSRLPTEMAQVRRLRRD